MTNIKQCPACGGTMRLTHHRKQVVLIERYRYCRDCGHRDKALCEPEKVIKILPVSVRTHTSPTTSLDDSSV